MQITHFTNPSPLQTKRRDSTYLSAEVLSNQDHSRPLSLRQFASIRGSKRSPANAATTTPPFEVRRHPVAGAGTIR
jgi:hypothetical protein